MPNGKKIKFSDTLLGNKSKRTLPSFTFPTPKTTTPTFVPTDIRADIKKRDKKQAKREEVELYFSNLARTPNQRFKTVEEARANNPILKVLNTPIAKEAIKNITDATSNIPIKAAARLNSIGSLSYNEAYKSYETFFNSPERGFLVKGFNAFQSTLPQTAFGVLLSIGASTITRSPAAGRAVASTYFGILSAGEQIDERGKVYSLQNIAIDTIGDQLLGDAIANVLQRPGKSILKALGDSFLIEANTEVAQTFLKLQNNYQKATNEEERQAVIEQTKNYILSGEMAIEWTAGGLTGSSVTGGALIFSPKITAPTPLGIKGLIIESTEEPKKVKDPGRIKLENKINSIMNGIEGDTFTRDRLKFLRDNLDSMTGQDFVKNIQDIKSTIEADNFTKENIDSLLKDLLAFTKRTRIAEKKKLPEVQISNLVGQVKEKIKVAEQNQPEFESKVNEISNKLGLENIVGEVKGKERIIEKALEAGGDVSGIRDINRTVMFVKDLNNVSQILDQVQTLAKEKFEGIDRVKLTIGEPSYNKVLVNVKLPGGGIGEIQLTTKDLWDVKTKGGGDILYHIARSPQTSAEVIENINARMNELYQFNPKGAFVLAEKDAIKGGFTRDLVRNIDFSGTPNITVSPYPERSQIFKGETITKSLAKFLSDNIDLLSQKGYKVGGWYNSKIGETFLDVAITVPKQFAAGAERLGKMANQIAGFDLKTGEEIPYGGTGTTENIASLEERQKVVDRLIELAEKGVKPTAGLKKVGLQKEASRFIKKRETTLLKERIRALARGAREGALATKKQVKGTQEEIISIIEKSKLEAKDKAKFIKTIKNVQTQEQLRQALPEIESRIVELEERAEQRTVRFNIKKELKTTKIVAKTGKPKGKFTPQTQKALDILREVVSLTPPKAEEKLLGNLAQFAEAVSPTEIAAQNKILNIWAGKRGIQGLNQLLLDVQKTKQTGQIEFARKQFNTQEFLNRRKSFMIERVTGKKGLKKGVETFAQRKNKGRFVRSLKTLGKDAIYDWHGLMNMLDWNNSVNDKKLSKEFGTLDQDNEYKLQTVKMVENISKSVSEAYNIPNRPTKVAKKLNDLSKKELNLGTFTNRAGVKDELIMTRGELINWWLVFQDPTLTESVQLGNNFTDEIINAINARMTEQDVAYARKIQTVVQAQQEKTNPIYSDINGVDIPSNPNYFPIRRSGFKVDTTKGFGEFLDEAQYRAGVTSSSFFLRKENILPLVQQDVTNVSTRHLKETNYYIAWASKIREFDNVFSDTNVREAIKQEFTPGLLHTIGIELDALTTNGNKHSPNWKVVDWFRTNFTVGVLMAKPALTAKQFVSVFAYLEKLNPVSFSAGMADFWKNPVKNWKILNKESTFIKTRGANLDRDINDAIGSDAGKLFSKKKTYVNNLMLTVRFGDKGAIVAGSWALRRKRLKQGVPLAEVIKEYENFSSETQQSADVSRLTRIQKAGSLAKLFTWFKSSQRQYLAKEANAIASIFQKDGFSVKNIGKVARIMTIYHVLLPVLFQFVVNLGGWDEDDKKDYLRAGVMGSFNGLFIFGDMVDQVVRTVLEMRRWPQEIPIASVANDISNAISKIDIDDITAEDMLAAVDALAGAGAGLGLPTEQVKNMSIGLVDIINGDIERGIGLLMGWSPFVVGKDNKKTSTKKKPAGIGASKKSTSGSKKGKPKGLSR